MKRYWLILSLAVALSIGCNANSGVSTASTPATVDETPITLPNAQGSLKFVVLGDFGNGGRSQYDLAATMARFHDQFKFDTVITVGDNLYGSQRPKDYATKFEIPYKPLLDAGVKFYATLGNHDSREQRNYALFNMGGKLYYTFKPPNQPVRFFMLDSNYPSPEQITWLENELNNSGSDWKIAVFHHPLYSSGKLPRIRSEVARGPGGPLRPEQRERGVLGARSLLRANQTPAGDRVLHRGFRGKTARR